MASKVQISVDDELLSRIDSYAGKNYLSRSGLISAACAEYLNQREMVIAIREISVSVRKIADSGAVDENLVKQLENFAKMAEFYTA